VAQPRTDFELLQAVLGKPRSAAEHRKFSRVWQQWQAAAARSARAASGNSGSGGGSWGGGSRQEGGRSSSSSRRGSAGASAGPRWGQADWRWSDFRQEEQAASSSSSSSSSSWNPFESAFRGGGDQEAWYQPPGGSGSRRAAPNGAWGWHSAWHSAWQQQQQQQQHPGGGSGWQHGDAASTASSMQLLGLESSWLFSRCGRLLQRAYLAKARALHPDVHAGSGHGAAAAAEAHFKEVQAAYEALQALVAPMGGSSR
jgi:hypothetical protein